MGTFRAPLRQGRHSGFRLRLRKLVGTLECSPSSVLVVACKPNQPILTHGNRYDCRCKSCLVSDTCRAVNACTCRQCRNDCTHTAKGLIRGEGGIQKWVASNPLEIHKRIYMLCTILTNSMNLCTYFSMA